MEFFSVWRNSNSLIIFAILILIAIFYWLLKFQRKLDLRWKEALLVAVIHIVIGWSAMRLLAILETVGNMNEAANMRLYGAIFILPILYFAWAKKTKRNVALTMDVATICVIIGAISGRLNCLTSGCCIGNPVVFYPSVRWPLRELELLYYVVFILIYCRKILRKKTHGEVYSIYLISYGLLRFVIEFMREEFTGQIGILHLAHIWSLLSIAVGTGIYYKLRKDQKNNKTNIKKAKSSHLAKGGNK